MANISLKLEQFSQLCKENRETHTSVNCKIVINIAEFLLFNNKINQNIISRNRDDLQKLWAMIT